MVVVTDVPRVCLKGQKHLLMEAPCATDSCLPYTLLHSSCDMLLLCCHSLQVGEGEVTCSKAPFYEVCGELRRVAKGLKPLLALHAAN